MRRYIRSAARASAGGGTLAGIIMFLITWASDGHLTAKLVVSVAVGVAMFLFLRSILHDT